MDSKIELLKTTNEYINNLKASISEVIKYLQSGEESKGFALIAEITNALSLVFEALESAKDVLKKDIYLQSLSERLGQVVEAIINEDTVLIVDLFEYEIVPELDNLKEVINTSIYANGDE